MSNLPLGLATILATGLALAGCCSNLSHDEPPPQPFPAGKPAATKPEAKVPRVTASARFVLIQGSLPEATGALSFLSDDAALREGKITLTKAQADAALAELTRITGAEVGSTAMVSLGSGNAAKMGIGVDLHPEREKKHSSVTVTVGGVPQEFTNDGGDAQLEVYPQVGADGIIQLGATIEVTMFDGFIEYPAAPGDGKKFYQPIFVTNSATTQVRIESGQTVVLRSDSRKKLTSADRIINVPVGWKMTADKTMLVFLTAAVEPVKR